MKPVIAKRKTTCTYCKEEISAGFQRLTDKWRIPAPNAKDGAIWVTKHFHFRKPNTPPDRNNCYDQYLEAYFDNMPEDEGERKSNNPKGRPRLDLTPEQRIERHRLIRKYHAQINYYIHGNKLDLTKPQMITEVTIQDVRRASRFRKNIKEIFEGLQQLGGIPRSLQPLAESLEDESLPDKTERAERRDRLQAPVEVDP